MRPVMCEGEILRNQPIANGIWDMVVLAPEIAMEVQPGQFVNLVAPSEKHLLPRPISVAGTAEEKRAIRMVYQVVGEGTRLFSQMESGEKIKLTGALGNGFHLPEEGTVVLAGGGIGIPPMLFLAGEIKSRRPEVNLQVFLGYRSQIFLREDFAAAGDVGADGIHIATDDGSQGFHGNVVALLEQSGIRPDLVCACGPKPMLKALAVWAAAHTTPLQVSMEERMACGIGACVGCVVKIKDQDNADSFVYKKVCKDGPVFDSREVMWDA